MQALRDKIMCLKITGMAETLDVRSAYAQKHKATHAAFLDQLMDNELNACDDRSTQRRLRHSKL